MLILFILEERDNTDYTYRKITTKLNPESEQEPIHPSDWPYRAMNPKETLAQDLQS